MIEYSNFFTAPIDAILESTKQLEFHYSSYGEQPHKAEWTKLNLAEPISHLWASAFEIAAHTKTLDYFEEKLKESFYMCAWPNALIKRNGMNGEFFRRKYGYEWGIVLKKFIQLAKKYSSKNDFTILTARDRTSVYDSERSVAVYGYLLEQFVHRATFDGGISEGDDTYQLPIIEFLIDEFKEHEYPGHAFSYNYYTNDAVETFDNLLKLYAKSRNLERYDYMKEFLEEYRQKD